MDRRLLDIIVCPACGGALELTDAAFATVEYTEGAREEVLSGAAACVCGQRYPITDYVLSFADRFPPILRREAAYWDRYYLWLLEQGSYGFHDLRRGQAPYITFGVPEPFPAADTLDRYDIHHQVAEHPLLRGGKTLLDIGVGLGWTSLYFARAGYEVTAFEPSLGPVTAAKRYAMEQGVFIEYICAALGAIAFREAGFDGVTAFHSLHHVPNLEDELRKIRTWLRPGGALAIDEHVGNSRLASAIGSELHAWAEAEIFPRHRTLPTEALASLPDEPHSALEDSSVDQVVPLVSRLFEVRTARPRHVFLDHYPLLYYLHTGRDLEAFRHALAIANQMQEMARRADPEGGDYVTIVAENTGVERPAGGSDQWSVVGDQWSVVGDQWSVVSGQPEPASQPDDIQAQAASITQGPSPEELLASQRRVDELKAQIDEQTAWAQGLEQELGRKNAELARLQTLIRGLENGRAMRLLRLLGGNKPTSK